MIAVDTSSLIAFFEGHSGSDTDTVESALAEKRAVLPAVVLTEIMSQPGLPSDSSLALLPIPLLEPTPGYWGRAGLTRAKLLAHGHKARIADALIAQSCIDHRTPLLTRDQDFHHFEKLCGLKLVKPY